MLAPDTSRSATPKRERIAGERGYSWLFLYPSSAWGLGFFITLVLLAVATGFYLWFDRPALHPQPYSNPALVYAFTGTAFFVAALVGFAMRRRARKRRVGQLSVALHWHIFLAIIALVLLIYHAFGHFMAISGTYALIGLIVLVLSGIIGRALDRILPRLIAAEVDKALTAQGDDRGESLSHELRAIVTQHNLAVPVSRQIGAGNDTIPPGDSGFNVPWDLAYISLEPTQEELDRHAPKYRLIPDRKSALSRVDVFMPPAERPMAEWHTVQQAMRREKMYRSLLRFWRVTHVSLAIIAVGLVIWHIVFVSVLFLPGLLPKLLH